MSGLILDRVASQWRMVREALSAFQEVQVMASVRIAIIPVSKLDQQSPYAQNATHIIWAPHWLEVRREDQFRYGRRPPDADGQVQPYIYSVNGRSPYSQGGTSVAFYVSERE